MISVLIPVRNHDPSDLAEALSLQLSAAAQPFEILISDDSDQEAAMRLKPRLEIIPGVTFHCRQNPLGRSANRNFLAGEARYPYLLFADGDAGVASADFISIYLKNLDPESVLCGGTRYSDTMPGNPEQLLRWKYGKCREQKPAADRNLHPWKSFSTFNFVIPADLFRSIGFDETIRGYGHEDTIFGIRLHESGVPIRHLDNGLCHLGLETAAEYLAKTRESAVNLRSLHERNLIPPKYINDIALLDTWISLKKIGLDKPVGAWFASRRHFAENRLGGPNPSIRLLDLYKLGAISHIG
jgi:glycosyltransferase involved in cell wall biosynthesis